MCSQLKNFGTKKTFTGNEANIEFKHVKHSLKDTPL